MCGETLKMILLTHYSGSLHGLTGFIQTWINASSKALSHRKKDVVDAACASTTAHSEFLTQVESVCIYCVCDKP